MSGVLQALTHGNGLSMWKTFTKDYQLVVSLVEDTSSGAVHQSHAMIIHQMHYRIAVILDWFAIGRHPRP